MTLKLPSQAFLHISNANVHDVNILDLIPYEAGSFMLWIKDILILAAYTSFTHKDHSL